MGKKGNNSTCGTWNTFGRRDSNNWSLGNYDLRRECSESVSVHLEWNLDTNSSASPPVQGIILGQICQIHL